MSEMIERVARAIAGKADDDFEPNREFWTEYAIAAVKAMREPNRKMLDAACKAMSPGRRPTPERVSVRAKHDIRYRAMIDSILTE